MSPLRPVGPIGATGVATGPTGSIGPFGPTGVTGSSVRKCIECGMIYSGLHPSGNASMDWWSE